ncbi:hypothetical protein PFISCL1PPCAC_21142, partial [Pristionchus fissidentatus]
LLAISETWLDCGDLDVMLLRGTSNHFLFRADRVAGRGGGVLLYAHINLLPITVSTLTIPGFEDVKPDIPLSDHIGIAFTINSFIAKDKIAPPSRDFSNADWDSMNNLIASHNWTLSFMGKSISDAYEYFSAFINDLIATYVPLKKPKSDNGYPKYLSILYNRLQRFHANAANSDLTHSLRSNNSSLPGILDDKGKILLTDNEKATAFSKFFSRVQTSPLSAPLSRPMVCQTHFDLPSIFPEQILLAISQLVPKCNGSSDKIPNILYCKCKFSVVWNMTLSAPKCCVLHLGRLKTRSKYTLNGLTISPSDTVRDLGVHFSKKLNFGYHITQITRKARSMCNLMLRSFHTNSPDILIKAYKIYIRPLLESSTVIWNPTAIGLVNRLENVQREFTRRVLKRSQHHPLSYLDRL